MKLKPIERRQAGSLPRMTAAQRRRTNVLIWKICCNYSAATACFWTMGRNVSAPRLSPIVCCKWFRWAVLPQDKALEAEIFHSDSVKRWVECGAAFFPRSNRAKYCEACAKRVHRRHKSASDRKRYRKTDK